MKTTLLAIAFAATLAATLATSDTVRKCTARMGSINAALSGK